MTKIILYHGSNMPVYRPKLLKQHPHDFGQAFYLTTDLKQAKRWADHKARKNVFSYVTCYTVDKEKINRLNIVHFKNADKNWLTLVARCRQDKYQPKADIVIGPVVDGQKSWLILKLYWQEMLSYQEAIDGLKVYNLTDQWAFTTLKSLKLLNLAEVKEYENHK